MDRETLKVWGQSILLLVVLYVFLVSIGLLGASFKLFGKDLAIQLKALGPEHPEVGGTYNNMAAVFSAQGDHDRALEHFRKALAIQEKALGPEHPSTLDTVFNMGLLHFNAGKKGAAKPLFVRAAEGSVKSLGPAHPNTKQAQKAVGLCG